MPEPGSDVSARFNLGLAFFYFSVPPTRLVKFISSAKLVPFHALVLLRYGLDQARFTEAYHS